MCGARSLVEVQLSMVKREIGATLSISEKKAHGASRSTPGFLLGRKWPSDSGEHRWQYLFPLARAVQHVSVRHHDIKVMHVLLCISCMMTEEH